MNLLPPRPCLPLAASAAFPSQPATCEGRGGFTSPFLAYTYIYMWTLCQTEWGWLIYLRQGWLPWAERLATLLGPYVI